MKGRIDCLKGHDQNAINSIGRGFMYRDKIYFGGYPFIFISWGFIVGIALILFSLTPQQYITSLLIDDALYFPVVANNIAQGYGSTFDNITMTNGYHPLWCWLNIPFNFLSQDTMTRLFIFKALVVLTVMAMLLIWYLLLKKIGLNNAAVSIFLLLMGGSYHWSIKVYYSGLETPLVTLLIGLTLFILHQIYNRPTLKCALLLGIATAGTFLARLDSIFFVFTLYLFWCLKNKKISKEIILALSTFAVIGMPYLLWNKIKIGVFVPVSGIRKTLADDSGVLGNLNRFRAYFRYDLQNLKDFLNVYILLIVILLIVIISCMVIKNRGRIAANLKKFRIFTILYVSTIMHFIYNLIFMNEMAVSWYQYLIYLSIFTIVAVIMHTTSTNSVVSRGAYAVFYIILISIMASMLKHAFTKFPRAHRIELVKAALYARNHLEPEAVYGIYDPGIFRFVSDRKTIGFNGLIGNTDMLRLVLAKKPEEIVRKYQIKYYVAFLSRDRLNQLQAKPLYLSSVFLSPYNNAESYIGIFNAEEKFWREEGRVPIFLD